MGGFGYPGMLSRLIVRRTSLETDMDPKPWVGQPQTGNWNRWSPNVVINARDAMPEGRGVGIGLERPMSAAPSESLHTVLQLPPGTYRDAHRFGHAGCGMSEDVLNQIFRALFTTKETNGTGLGLATVHSLSNRTAAISSVQAQPGSGTNMDIYTWPRLTQE